MDWFLIIEKIVKTKNATKFKIIIYIIHSNIIVLNTHTNTKEKVGQNFFNFLEKFIIRQEIENLHNNLYIHDFP